MAFTIKERRAIENEEMKVHFSRLSNSAVADVADAITTLKSPNDTAYVPWMKEYNKRLSEKDKERRRAKHAAEALARSGIARPM
jgi:hypothetical protein